MTDQFVVSARKYRPATFNSVVGQTSITGTLKNAIKNQHLAQAFLFCGPRGVGKTTCARILAKTINCTNQTSETEGCNECESCKAFNDGQSLNIFELDAASNNSVDDMRSLVDKVRYPPQSGKYKVYIIDEVHMLTVQAFNAFLKTLEEPPSYAIFILATTEKHKIIPTILSRCQIFDFNRITVNDITNHLKFIAKSEHVTAEPEALHLIAQKADGALRDALSIFDQIVSFAGEQVTYKHVIENLNILDYEYYFKVTDTILEGNYKEALLILNELMEEGYEIHHFITGLASHFRDLLVCKDPQTIQLLEVGGNTKAKYQAQSEQCSPSLLFRCLEITNRCDFEFKLSQNQRLHTELALLKMCSLNSELSETVVKSQTETHSNKKKVTETKLKTEIKVATELPVENTVAEPLTKVNKPINSENKTESTALHETVTKKSADQKVSPVKPATLSQPKRSRTGTVSITSKLNKPSSSEKNQTPDEGITHSKNDQPVNSEIVTAAIKEFVEQLFADGRKQLAVALNKHKPVLLENHIIEIPVDNAILSDDIQDNKPELLSWLKQKLSNRSLEIHQRVVNENELQNVAYTPAEKYSKMAAKNPNLNKLRQQFDLDIDF